MGGKEGGQGARSQSGAASSCRRRWQRQGLGVRWFPVAEGVERGQEIPRLQPGLLLALGPELPPADMDLNRIIQALKGTIDPKLRIAAETELNQVSEGLPLFLSFLLFSLLSSNPSLRPGPLRSNWSTCWLSVLSWCTCSALLDSTKKLRNLC